MHQLEKIYIILKVFTAVLYQIILHRLVDISNNLPYRFKRHVALQACGTAQAIQSQVPFPHRLVRN